MDFTDLSELLSSVKGGIDVLKGARDLLPKGKNRDELENKIQAAEDILKRADAKLAKDLGYNLCQCTFPPQIMLWREPEQSYVCPSKACGRRIVRSTPPRKPKIGTVA